MAKLLVCYHSRSGHTKRMAELVTQGVLEGGVEADMREVADVRPEEMMDYDGVILGSPTYYGHCAGEIKTFIDESVKHHRKLDGKVGGAFTSSANLAGGNETAILGMLQMLMIHGMVVQGDPRGSHYGPVSVGKPDERAEAECVRYGKRVARLTLRLLG